MLVETLGNAKGKGGGAKSPSLTQVEAIYRRNLISDTQYEVSMALPKGNTYFGHTTIKFNIKTPPTADDKNSLFLDYQGQKIQNFIINGKKLDALDNTQYEKNTRIMLPKSNLK